MAETSQKKIGEVEIMEKRLAELSREIDMEYLQNYLVFRLDDVRDLVKSLEPYKKDRSQDEELGFPIS